MRPVVWCLSAEMNFILILCFVFGFIEISSHRKTTQVTLPIEDRVALLKRQIDEQLKIKHVKLHHEKQAVDEDVEYVNRDNEPILPINEKDPRKKKEMYKLKEIKTTRNIRQDYDDFDRKDSERSKKKGAKQISHKMASQFRNRTKTKKVVKPEVTDVFYRRSLPVDKCAGKGSWTHCQDLITPYLLGHKDNMTVTKRVTYDNHIVIRLIQLLTEDITDHSKNDIHSILYQISNLQLRLFQWDVAAIKLLLHVIHKDKSRHSFKTLKAGLKDVFRSWNLRFDANVTALIKQTRIFRPPCLKITENEGSTVTPKTIRFSKPTKKPKCAKDDEICKMKANNNG